jgi:arginase
MNETTKPVVKENRPTQSAPAKVQNRTRLDSVTLIYVPIYFGGRHRGTSMGPAALQCAELAERLRAMGMNVAEEVDIAVPNSRCWLDDNVKGSRCVPEIRQVSLDVAHAVEMAMHKNTMPITIGGDHSLAIGSLAGVSSYHRKQKNNCGLVWFDAHGDINTPETSPSGNVHGMPLAVGLGHGDKKFTDLLEYSPKFEPHKTVLIGARDLDMLEREMITKTGITVFSMRDIDQLGLGSVMDLAFSAVGYDVDGLHLSFDIDVMDPDAAPGVSTPARGGLTYREAVHALTLLAETGLVRSFDIAELNPAFDVQNRTAELAVELIMTALGQRIL